jgi:hypothetical protein
MSIFIKSIMGELGQTENPDTKETLISAFETGVLQDKRLPEDYREHMKQYNGGLKAEDGDLYYTNYESPEGELILKTLFHLTGPGPSVEKMSKLNDNFPNLITIGSFYGGVIMMSLQGGSYGKIYMRFSYTEPEKVADTFTEFLDGLEYD